MRTLVIFFSITFFVQCVSLAQNIDSLVGKIQSSQLGNIERIEILNILSRDLSYIDSKRSLIYANNALTLSVASKYELGEAYAYRNLGNIYAQNEIYFSAMEYVQNALNIFTKLNDSAGIANCYISLGHIYGRLRDVKQEIYYHRNSYEIFVKLKNRAREGVCALNLGESYYNKKNYDSCRVLTQHSIIICRELNQKTVLSACYKVMGLLEFSQKNYVEAEKYFKNVLKISAELGINSQKNATIESMIKLFDISNVNQQPDSQTYYLNQALDLCKKYNNSAYLPEIYNKMILYYSEAKDLTMVQKYILEYKMVSDTITKRNLKDKSDLVNSLVQVHNLEKEKTALVEHRILQEQSIQRRDLLLLVTFIASFLLIALVVVLSRVNKKMTDANRALTVHNETIEEQKRNLQVLIATKDKLFSIIAHDLRSPFAAILGISEVLVGRVEVLGPVKTTKFIESISQSAKSTLDLLDKLLTWARNQTGQISFYPQKMNFTLVMNEVFNSLDSSANIKNISLNYAKTADIEVFADLNMLITILRNLIQNSIKFTHNNGKIEIYAVENENDILITVSDNGIGMGQEIIDTLFLIDKKKVMTGTNNEKGSGIGLLLCKEFVEKHGGKIWVESRVGEGSLFKFTLPLMP